MKYTEKELIDFGNYLLSVERTSSIQENPLHLYHSEEILKSVTDADICNWKIKNNIEIDHSQESELSFERAVFELIKSAYLYNGINLCPKEQQVNIVTVCISTLELLFEKLSERKFPKDKK